MGYIYDFDIGSLLFFGLTIFFYLYQKRIKNLKDSIFTAMLAFCMIAITFDFAAAYMEYQAMRYPIWLLYAVNMLFIFGMQTCLPLFFFYAVASAGRYNRFSGLRRAACLLPYVITMLLLFVSPFTDIGICYISRNHIYHHGLTHTALYINVGLYVLGGLAVLCLNASRTGRLQRNLLLFFAGLLFTASLIQLLYPRYLLTASATALALTCVFYALQSPVDQIDPLTGAFSRTLLPELLKDYSERGREYSLALYSLRSFGEFTRLYGDDAGNALLKTYAENLMARYAKDITVYMDACEFIVVCDGFLSKQDARALYARAPKTINVGEYGAVRVDMRLGAINLEHGESADDVLTLADFMLGEMRVKEIKDVLYADAEYKSECYMKLNLEATLGNMLREDKMEVFVSSVYDSGGRVVMDEALLQAPGEMCGFVSPHRLMRSAGQGGYARDYYKTLLKSLYGKRDIFDENRKLCLPLISPAFLSENAPDEMLSLVTKSGFTPAQIAFSVEESEIASFKSALSDKIRRFSENGFSFMLDAFAEGYTDMSFVISLPFARARLHDSLVRDAKGGGGAEKLLRGIIGILADVGIDPVCRVLDEETKKTVSRCGGKLFQDI